MARINFSKYKNKKILLLCHENADLDAITSATIFYQILKNKKINSVISVPSHINEQALQFIEKEKIFCQKNPDLESFNQIFLFDFNDYEQLGSLREKFTKLQSQNKFDVISFDHHVIEKRSIDSSKIGIGEFYSTTQLLFNFFKKEFNKKMFFYACLGMLEDTGHFIVADKKLFDDFSYCLDNCDKSFSEIVSLTKPAFNKGERIAFLKAAQRAKIIDLNGVIVIFSNVSFFQGPAATKLLSFGADISLVYGSNEKRKESSLSCRADSFFKEKNKFNLVNDLLKELQNRVGGEIGGHSGAAMWKGKSSQELIEKNCLEIIKSFFN